MGRTAVEIVRAYGVDAWNEGRDDWIPELCADPIIRHDANREVRLSHAEQRARMRHNYEELRPTFEPVVLAGDDEHVTLVWNVTGRDPNWKLCGIEIFRVADGRIVEVWNSTYMDGRWGLSKSLGGSVDGGSAVALPLVRSDLVSEGNQIAGQLLVPADADGLAAWLTQLFGRPTSKPVGALWNHVFAPGGTPAALELKLADAAGPTLAIDNIAMPALTIALERSGLVNAVIELAADAREADATDGFPTLAPARLAETIGAFRRDGQIVGHVADAAITIAPDGRAKGHVALRLDDPAAANGDGILSLGWRHGDLELVFEGPATLSPSNASPDESLVQPTQDFAGTGFTARLVNAHAAFGADI